MKTKKFWVSFSLIAVIILSTSYVWADLTTLEIQEIMGPDRTPDGNSCITVYGLGFNAIQDVLSGSSGSSYELNIQPIQVLKKVDETSPQIFRWLAKNDFFTKATIKVWKNVNNENYINYYEIELKDVLCITMSTTSGQSQDQLLELISLSFRRIKITVTPIKPDGTAGASQIVEWDLYTNTEG
jgi:type VI secretion system Hcp family effector